MVAVGRLMDSLPEVAELDLNPVIVTTTGAVVVDARIRLAPAGPLPRPISASCAEGTGPAMCRDLTEDAHMGQKCAGHLVAADSMGTCFG
ncbi:acetate--CoA ligase family protein [Herbidospora solisilvae]|uniref:acetate--CoA ligase family protein n=1 Tax=Herbidospora solisilvae TaxID=2696284 RepID=UPI002E27FE20|nr:acetate--CoA ligase family protein [Herbidospora solisilvae]